LTALFNDKHWQKSGNISRLLRSIIFWRRRHLELNMDSFIDGCVPQSFSDITKKCVCLLIFISFLEIEMLRHDPASSVSPINGQISKVQSCTEGYRVVQSCIEWYRVVQSCTEPYRVVQSRTELYSIVQWYGTVAADTDMGFICIYRNLFNHLANRDQFLHKDT
jgi:hypothetical protein